MKEETQPAGETGRQGINDAEERSPDRTSEKEVAMNSIEPAQSQSNLEEEVLAEEAYRQVEPELDALPADKVMQVNLDIKNVTATGIGCKPKVEALRDELLRQLRNFNPSVIERIDLYAYALLYAQSVYQATCEPHDELPELGEQAVELRDMLHGDAVTLVRRKFVSTGFLDDYTALSGYKNLAADLQLLCTALGRNYASIKGLCGVSLAEIELAGRLAAKIVRLVGLREQAPARIAEAADKRARAFTLFVNCHDEIRRAVSYVRWHHDDLEEIAPSLYAGRRRRAAEKSDKPSGPAPASPSTPAPTPVPPAPVNHNLDSLPGGSPFIS